MMRGIYPGLWNAMKLLNQYTRKLTSKMTSEWMPFADVATAELPLPRLLRLSMFQLSIGLATALLVGTLNRVMIVELGVPAWWVALSVALPLVFAPLRALIGFKSDKHRSALGLRRLPYLWIGTLLLFGGLAIMPFALLALTVFTRNPPFFDNLFSRRRFAGPPCFKSLAILTQRIEHF